MFYKVEKGTKTYDELQQLAKRMRAAQKEVHPILDELGVSMYSPARALAGGISAIKFEARREGWKQVGKPGQKLYAPTVKNTAMVSRFAALTILPYDDLNTLVGFSAGTTGVNDDGAFTWSNCPGVQWREKAIAIKWPGKKAPTNKDLVEILESEYDQLCAAKK